jgi:putative methionine-R-sulfoxide reductase with GAF domain
VPVRGDPGGAVLGTIDVESDRVNPFTGRDRELLEYLCGSVGRALEV